MDSGPRRLPFALSFVNGEGRLVLRDLQHPPLHLRRLDLQITGLTFPFDLTGGAERLRDRWMETHVLEVSIELSPLRRAVAEARSEAEGLSHLALALNRGGLELVGRLSGDPPGPWFIIRYEPDIIDGLGLLFRPTLFLLLGPPVVSFPQIASALYRLAAPHLERRGLDLALPDIPKRVLQRIMLPAGFRLPDQRRLKLISVEVAAQALELAFSSERPVATALPTASRPLGEIAPLLNPGDDAVASGDLDAARRRYLAALGQEPGHPSITCRLAWLDAVEPRRRVSAAAACHRAETPALAPELQALMASLDIANEELESAATRIEALTERFGPVARARILLWLGRQKARRDPSSAAVALESALQLDPSELEPLEALRDVYARIGRREQLEWAGARLAAAREAPEDRARALAELGRLFHTKFNDLDRAIRHYEEALLHWPDSTKALFGLAECHALKASHQAALRCLDAVDGVAQKLGDKDLQIRAHIRAGEYWEEQGELNAAAARFHRALEIDPADRLALERSATVDISLGRHQQGEAALQRLLRIADESGDRDLQMRSLIRLAWLNLDGFEMPGPASVLVDRLRQEFPSCSELSALERRLTDLHNEAQPPSAGPAPSSIPRPNLTSVLPPSPTAPRPSPQPRLSPPAEPAAGAQPSRSAPEDLETALQSYLSSPDDGELASSLIDRLEAAGDWPRLVAMLAAQVERVDQDESIEARAQKADFLSRMGRALFEGLGDAESGADAYLRAAEVAEPLEGADLARRAATLLTEAEMAEASAEAEALAFRLDELAFDRSDIIHVVGAAIIRDGACLITRRSATMTHPLKWEFPGGKVEPGESPETALRRELREELRIEIRVGDHIGRGTGHLGDRTIVLDVYQAEWLDGELTLSEHHEHGWFGPDQLLGLDWPEADLPILPELQERMRRQAPR